jgi:photosystem II stability/assembly factor-like uncharacterized protein
VRPGIFVAAWALAGLGGLLWSASKETPKPTPLSPAVVTGQVMQPIGPIDFVTAREGFVGAGRSILFTSDGGRHWQSRALPDGLAVMRLVFSPDGVGYAVATSTCGIHTAPCGEALLMSRDNGRRWSVLRTVRFVAGQPTPDAAVSLSPRGVPYVVFGRQLIVGRNRGAGWEELALPPGSPGLVAYAAPGVLFLGVNGCGSLSGPAMCTRYALMRKSLPGGAWRTVWQGPEAPATVDMVSPMRGYLLTAPNLADISMGGVPGTLWTTDNGGRTWRELQTMWSWGTPNETGWQDAMQFTGPDTGWIAVGTGAGPGRGGLEMTRDGGYRWVRLDGDRQWSVSSLDFVTPQDGWITGSRLGQAFLLHTGNGGRSFAQVLPPPSPTTAMDMVSATQGYGLGSAAYSSTVLKTRNGGVTWMSEPFSGGTPLAVSFPPTPGTPPGRVGWLVAETVSDSSNMPQRLTVYRTADGGQRWLGQSRVDGSGVLAFRMRADGTGLLETADANGYPLALWVTHDGGHRWRNSPFHPAPGVLWWASMTPTGRVYVLESTVQGTDLRLQAVNPGTGASITLHQWAPLPADAMYQIYGFTMVSDRKGMAWLGLVEPGVTTPFLATTHDGGHVWAMRALPGALAPLNVTSPGWDMVNGHVGYLIALGGLYRTQDAGASWQWVTSGP